MVKEFSHRTLAGAKQGRRRLLFATIFILLLLILDLVSGGLLRSFTRGVGAAVWTGTSSVRASIDRSGYFASKRGLANENATLQERVATLTERASAYEAVTEENDMLRSILLLNQGDRGITAPVVSSFRASPYGTFVVGAGTGDPISAGDLVLTEGGFVAGRVEEVRASTALVRTLFAPDTSIEVIVGGAAVVAEGRGGGNARAIVPRGIDLNVGDPVVAPTLGSRRVGIVGKVESDPAGAEQTVYISLPVNLSALRFVYLVTTP